MPEIGERYTLFCGECGTELIRNEIFIRCPTCNIVDFTEQGEARFPGLARVCRKNEVNLLEFMNTLGGK